MSTARDRPTLDAAYDACRAVAKREARNFYYAFLALPRARRRAIYAVYAFSRLADDIADGPGPTREKRTRLADLRSRLRDAYAGCPRGPVLTALADAAATYRIPEALFRDLLHGVETDLDPRRFPDFPALAEYCYHVASVVGLISVRVFGFRDDPRVREHAVDLGIAMQLTNILRDLREDVERDRVYLPQDELRRFGYSEDDLAHGVLNPPFRALMRFQTARARRYFDSGARLLPLIHPESRGCAAGLHHLYRRLLHRIERRDYDVFSARVSLSSWEKLRLTCRLWAASRIPGVRR